MAGFFSRFKRGRRGRRGSGRSGRGSGGAQKGERRVGPSKRDPHMETEFVATTLPPSTPRPAPVPVPSGAPPPAAAPAAAPPPAPAPMPAAAPPPPAAAPAAASGGPAKTEMIKIGRPSSKGVVAVLIGVDGKLRDEVFKVFDGENTLGRMQTAEIYLGEVDKVISREHAQIIHREGAFGLKPLKEENPTYLNGDIVEGGAPLSDGDEISVGDSKLRFRVV